MSRGRFCRITSNCQLGHSNNDMTYNVSKLELFFKRKTCSDVVSPHLKKADDI